MSSSSSIMAPIRKTPYFLQRRLESDQEEHPHQPVSQTAIGILERPPTRRIRTLQGMRTYLRVEEGIEFVPKSRPVTVPKKEFEQHSYGGFLSRHAIIDRFGSNHVERDVWYQQQKQIVNPQLFDSVVRENQFTLSSTGSALNTAYWLFNKHYADEPELSHVLQKKYKQMQHAYRGELPDNKTLLTYVADAQEHYAPQMYAQDLLHKSLALYYRDRYRLLSYEDKLAMVHTFSDIIVASLWHIARYNNPSAEARKIYITGNRRKVKVPKL